MHVRIPKTKSLPDDRGYFLKSNKSALQYEHQMGHTVDLVVLFRMLQGFVVLYSPKCAFEHACVCVFWSR